jgi:hypothetical protein
MITFKEYIIESVEHPELQKMGVTKAHIDAFNKYKEADADYEKHDPEFAPRGVKVARTKALKQLHSIATPSMIHKMNSIHDYEGKEKLK